MTPAELVADQVRFLAAYAKRYGAGAFGSPLADEVKRAQVLDEVGPDGKRTVAVVREITRTSRRRDWTGRAFHLPAGSLVARIGRDPGPIVPPWLLALDYVVAPVEDHDLTRAMITAYRSVVATQITAAGEILRTWGPPGTGRRETAVDLVTCARLPSFKVPYDLRGRVLAELDRLTGWDDDYPFYSDGTWSQLSLRGFWTDPTRGLKPSEMPKAWKAEHPDDVQRVVGWTDLARDAPGLVELTHRLGFARMERVRLMRMAGHGPRGRVGGKLARHTDITDRTAGTGFGQVARFHLPLVTDPAVVMHTWDLDGHRTDTHLAPWRAWYLDARKPHAVTNPTSTDRIHLVVDAIVDEAVLGRITEETPCVPLSTSSAPQG